MTDHISSLRNEAPPTIKYSIDINLAQAALNPGAKTPKATASHGPSSPIQARIVACEAYF
jgi:hypothetical protein